MALAAHLWTHGPAPLEWIEYVLCDKFKCLPAELRAQPHKDILNLLTCMNMEAKVAQKRRGRK